MAFPAGLVVEVAFTTPAMSTSPVYVDVTNLVQSFTTSRGRSDELTVIQPGTCSVTFDDLAGVLDPDNTTGPYFGKLRPNRKVRISARAGTALTVAAPTGLTATASTGGGIFAAGTFFYRITYTAAQGESTPSNEVSATVAANDKVALSWAAAPEGADQVLVYRATTAGALTPKLVAMLPASRTVHTDLGTVGADRTIPTANTTSTLARLFTGYADLWRRQPADRTTVMQATDRFKILARRRNTLTRVEEFAAVRLSALLDNGATPIIPAAERRINDGAFASRTLIAYTYDAVNTLQAINDVSLSDGGQVFMAGDGAFVFQATRYRTNYDRSLIPQATFGNTTGTIRPTTDLQATVSDDVMANYVTVTDGAGGVKVAQDAASIAEDGLLELDVGNTILRPADAQDRVDDVLLLRKDPRPRYDRVSVDCVADPDALAASFRLEISDRISVKVVEVGRAQGYSRDSYVESVEHDVDLPSSSWITTYSLSGSEGGATVISP